ncbi:MAG: MEKHLA domain-containing protein [Gammaproteobacteria bacterium]|nr:MEKHLA domain-containing protein [Gammaproteobacteria bacterium]
MTDPSKQDEPSTENSFLADHVAILLSSHRHWTGCDLLEPNHDPVSMAERLYTAPFIVVSHGTEEDPLFNYGNLQAQKLFEMEWLALVGLPSRKSAERINRSERRSALDQVENQGYMDNYQGIRVSSSGRHFRIKNALLWNLIESNGNPYGQAACFSEWVFI